MQIVLGEKLAGPCESGRRDGCFWMAPCVRVGMGEMMAASSSCKGGDGGRDGCLILV